MQTPQGYCYVTEGRQVDIQAAFKCNRKKYKSKKKKRKETNSALHKAKYLSLFKLGLEKSPSSAYLVYLLMHVSSVFVLGTCCYTKCNNDNDNHKNNDCNRNDNNNSNNNNDNNKIIIILGNNTNNNGNCIQ